MPLTHKQQPQQLQPQQQKPPHSKSNTNNNCNSGARERTQTIGETDMDQSVLNGLQLGVDGSSNYHGHKRELGHSFSAWQPLAG